MKKNLTIKSHKNHKKNKRRFLLFGASILAIIISVVILLNNINHRNIMQDYEDSSGEIIVLMNDDVDGEKAIDYLIQNLDSVTLKKHIDNYLLLSAQDVSSFANALSELDKHPLVDVVQPNATISSMGFTNDPYIDSQWAINNPGHYSYYSGNSGYDIDSMENMDMDLIDAWEYMGREDTKRREVVVAIIDTGIDYTHPDLADNLWVNPMELAGDGTDNDNNGYVDDIHGWDFYNDDNSVGHYEYNEDQGRYLASTEDNDNHGTHIAGIIGAVANNNIGIAGLASNIDIKIMALKINGGTEGTGYISHAVEAIKYATMMGADICNISWGTYNYNEALKKVIEDSDMLFVAAAGNEGTDNDSTPIYPANYDLDNLISVAFVDHRGELSSYSNYGLTTVDVAAPGHNIYSTVVGGYAYMSGSSMAAPHVSALAALLYSYDDNLYPANVKEIILNNVKQIDGLENYMIHGGIPSAFLAVNDTGSLEIDNIAPKLNASTVYGEDDYIIPITFYDNGGSGIRTIRYMSGRKEIEDFNRGMEGARVEDDYVVVMEPGSYTFYASDYAGNEMILVHQVKEDRDLDTFMTYNYTDSYNYETESITVNNLDKQINIPRIENMDDREEEVKEILPVNELYGINYKVNRVIFVKPSDMNGASIITRFKLEHI